MKQFSRITHHASRNTHHASDPLMVFGILGDERVQRSKSPLMHNAVMRLHGMHGVYVPFEVRPENVGAAVRGIRGLGICGVNVTVPHKEAVVPHLDTLSEEASAIGAVNTIVRRGEVLEGHNTDIGGFTDALEQTGLGVAGKTALVFGAGGAAKAVLVGLGSLGARPIWLTSRTLRRAEEMAAGHGAMVLPLDRVRERAPEVDLLINATSVSSPEEGPELAALAGTLPLPKCSVVLDLNYGRQENFWERLAQAKGADFMDGIAMLVHQARRSFTLWTGIPVTADEFMQALRGGP
jgi:shikimate dehydrogenase